MASRLAILREKKSIAEKVARHLRQNFGANLAALGLRGSVARGTAETFSDIDLLVILRRLKKTRNFEILDNTYCSLNFETWKSATSTLREPHHEFPETLGGFTKILPVYDPGGLLPRLEREARLVPSDVFRKSAELALIHSFEDFCRAKNAFLNKDEVVLIDSIQNVTHSAANVVAALNGQGFVSDRELFKAYKKFKRLPRNFSKIQALRYGHMSGPKLFETMMQFYVDLVEFSKQRGISFPVTLEVIERLS